MKQRIGTYEFDAQTRAEGQADLEAALGHHFDRIIREQLRGVKPLKLPIVSAVAAGTTTILPINQGAEPIICGPQQGYFWRVGRVTIASTGTDTGAISLYAGSDITAVDPTHLVDNTLKVGQAYYPGTRGLFLWPGEQLYASITSVVTNSYRMTGIAIEVPAEMAGKLLV